MDPFDRLRDAVHHLADPAGDAPTPPPGDLRERVLGRIAGGVAGGSAGGADPGDRGGRLPLKAELGELLAMVLQAAHGHAERGAFTVDEVLDHASDRMGTGARRGAVPTAHESASLPGGSVLDGLPASPSALVRAWHVGTCAAAVGFDWPDLDGVRAKVDEELAELDAAVASGDDDDVEDELGDVLFTLVHLARFLRVPPDDALRRATGKFERRFRVVERLCLAEGATVLTSSADTLERHWMRAKEIA